MFVSVSCFIRSSFMFPIQRTFEYIDSSLERSMKGNYETPTITDN